MSTPVQPESNFAVDGNPVASDQFRLLVENVSDYAIFGLDPAGNITSWNLGAEKIKGYAAHEIIGQHFSKFYLPDAIAAGWPQHELELAKAEGRFEDEGWRIRKDGSRFWANVVITALYDENRRLRGFAKITRDLTAAKEAQRLEEEGRQTHRFLAVLAHELRNPLAPIASAVKAMEIHATPETMEWARKLIERQTTQLGRLVDDLLDISRVNTGKIVLRNETFDLREVVHAAEEAMRSLINEHGHIFSISVPNEPVWVHGDRVRLVQTVVNLLSNAAKYTQDSGKIFLGLATAGDTAHIVVRDNGMGIPKQWLPRVFDLFSQVDARAERTEGGLGIGLSLVKELIALHGGTVEAISAGPGQGSEFVVTLPLRADIRACAPEPALKAVSGPGRKARVLIVDDNEDACESLAVVLRTMNYATECCLDPTQTTTRIAAFHPDAVLLDLGMPGMNGYEVARQIRKTPGLGKLMLIALTGYGSPEDKALTAAAGFDYHMVKPVDLDELQRLLNLASDAPNAAAHVVQ
jgi:PAS domain S-box-containing protein